MKISTLQLPLALLTFFATSSAFAMTPMLERILAGIDTVPTHADLFMALDEPVAELESAASDSDAPLYYRIRATSFLSTLNAEGGRDALLRLCDSPNNEIRRHAVYGLLRSTKGPLHAAEWTKIDTMLTSDNEAIRKDIVRGFRWSQDPRSSERLTRVSTIEGPLKSLALHVIKRRAVLLRAER